MKHASTFLALLLLPLGLLLAAADSFTPASKAAPGETPASSPSSSAVAGQPLYTQEGTDSTFATLLESGVLKPGERFFEGPVLGSRIHVNHELLERQVGKIGSIPNDIGLHTQACGDSIRRKDFRKWTRWYQEDGNTQVFRLFKGEQNIRGGSGKDGSPGRVEAFSNNITTAPGTWHEWEGTYTVVKPVNACIFQLMHEGSLWPFHIEMSEKGGISFLRRRPVPGLEREIVLADNMVGKSLSIKVRANGEEYEVYQKSPLGKDPWKLVTKGSYTKANDNKISFRWGMYCGSKKGQTVPNDAMLFVTGVTIR